MMTISSLITRIVIIINHKKRNLESSWLWQVISIKKKQGTIVLTKTRLYFCKQIFLSLAKSGIQRIKPAFGCVQIKLVWMFRHPKKRINYDLKLKLHGKRLCLGQKTKYLWVHIDENLSWKTQLNKVAKKLRWANGIISKLRHFTFKNNLGSKPT